MQQGRHKITGRWSQAVKMLRVRRPRKIFPSLALNRAESVVKGSLQCERWEERELRKVWLEGIEAEGGK